MLLKTSARRELSSTAVMMKACLHICGNMERFPQEHPDAPNDRHSKEIANTTPSR